jgi:antirestriction protein ArdC
MATQHPTEDVLDQLREGIATLTSSERWTRWLEAQSRFHHYSFGNTLLILLQRPDATRVAGYRAWLQLRRQVRKGEKGIAIIAPIANRIRVEDENGEERVLAGSAHAFRVAHVFDIAQTDGDDLPTVSDRLSGDDPDEIYSQLVAVAHSLGFTVEEDYLDGGVNGDCSHSKKAIRVEVRNEPAQQVKTLAHELSHAILHGEEFKGTREIGELEAESVAYIVCQNVGLDSSAYSFGYVASWIGGGPEAIKAITASGQRIVRAARQILDADPASEKVAA